MIKLPDGEWKWFREMYQAVKNGELPETTHEQIVQAMILRIFDGWEFYKVASNGMPFDSLVPPDYDRSVPPPFPRSMFQFVQTKIPCRTLSKAFDKLSIDQQGLALAAFQSNGIVFPGDKHMTEALVLLHIVGYDFI